MLFLSRQSVPPRFKLKHLTLILPIFLHGSALGNPKTCSPGYKGAYFGKIQSRGDVPLKVGQQLLNCGTLQDADEVFFWTSFYLDSKKLTQEKANLLKSYRAVVNKLGKKNDALRAARLGSPQTLRDAVRSGDDAFKNSLISHLTLSRALAWQGKFGQSVEAYDQFLNLARNNDKGELEKLYVLIWSGNTKAANQYLFRLKRYDNSPWMGHALKRAETYLTTNKGATSFDQNQDAVSSPGDVQISLSTAEENTEGDKSSLKGEWLGEDFAVNVQHFQVKGPLDRKRHSGSAFSVGYHYEDPSYQGKVNLGYFSETESPTIYSIEGSLTQDDFLARLSFKRLPLVEEVLPLDGIDVARETIGMLLGLAGAGLESRIQKDGDDSAWEEHFLRYKLGLSTGPGEKDKMNLTLQIRLEKRNRATTHYETLSERTGIAALFHMTKDTAYGTFVDLLARYESFQIKLWDNNKSESDQELELNLRFRNNYSGSTSYFFGIDHWQRFNEDIPIDRNRETGYSLGITARI